MISETTFRRLLLDIVLGRETVGPLTPEEEKARANLVRQVDEIKRLGGTVEIPFGLPGDD